MFPETDQALEGRQRRLSVSEQEGSILFLGPAGSLLRQRVDAEAPSMRIFKPHGCIRNHGTGAPTSPLQRQQQCLVLTSADYFHSKDIRQRIYQAITQDAQVSTTLFIGYSLEDYTFRNMFFRLRETLGQWNSKSYSVGPDNQPLRFSWRSESVRENFKTTLVNDNFDTFMVRLTVARGYIHPKLRQLVKDMWAQAAVENANAIGTLQLSDITNLPDDPP